MMIRFLQLACIGAMMLPSTLLAQEHASSQIEHLNSGKVLPANLPFSEAVRVGNTLYLSGQIGIVPGTLGLVPGGIGPESARTLENIKLTLEEHGYRLSDVVKCTIMLEDIGEWSAFNEVYADFFDPPYPARSAFGADGLAVGAAVEVDCIAVRSGDD